MKYCEEYAALLDAFVDNELSVEDAERVRKHLSCCDGCNAYVSDILALHHAFTDLEAVQAPDGLADGVCAAIRANAAPRKKNTRWMKTAASLAACAAIVFAASHVISVGGNSTPMTATAGVESFAASDERCAPPAAMSSDDIPTGLTEHDNSVDSDIEGTPSETDLQPSLKNFQSTQSSGLLKSGGTSPQSPQNSLTKPSSGGQQSTLAGNSIRPSVQVSDAAAPAYQNLALDIVQTADDTYENRLLNLDRMVETYYLVGSTFQTTAHTENGSAIAWYGKIIGTPHLDPNTLYLSFADGSIAQLPLPKSYAMGTAEPSTMMFDGSTLIYEITFDDNLSDETTPDPNDFIHVKGTYHYTVDLETKTVCLEIQ